MQSFFSADRGFVDISGGEFYILPDCHQCKPGYNLVRGICNPPLPPPQFVEGHGHLPNGSRLQDNTTIVFGLPVAADEPLFIFQANSSRNSTKQGPITYKLKELFIAFTFTLNATTGMLYAPKSGASPFFGALSITVVATEGVDDCATLPDGKRSCESEITMQLLATGFSNCPSDQNYYVQDGSLTAAASWTPPVLVPNNANSISSTMSHQPGSFGVGSVDVVFESDQLDVGTARCTFRVSVHIGIEVPINKVGELRSRSQLLFFLIDGQGVTDARRDTPVLPLADWQSTVSVGFTIEGSQHFTADIPPGVSAQFIVEMAWCKTTQAGLTKRELVFNGTGMTTLVAPMGSSSSVRAQVSTIQFNDLGSGFTESSNCFVFRGISEAMTEGISIKALKIKFQAESSLVATENSTLTGFRLIAGSSVFLQYSASVGDAVASMEDFKPPTWISCPGSLHGWAKQEANGSAVSWNVPLAIDTGGAVVVSSTNSPGDYFSLDGSPHTVTYVAEDTAGLKSRCTFQVIVEHVTVANAFVGGMDTHFSKVVVSDQTLDLVFVTQSIASKVSDTNNSFSQFVTDLTVDLHGLNSITITLALPTGRATLRPDIDALKTVLEVNMAWAISPATYFSVTEGQDSNAAVKASFSFDGFEQMKTGDVECCKAGDNIFASVTAELDSSGEWIRISGISQPVSRSFNFSGITLTLDWMPEDIYDDVLELRSLRLLDDSYLQFKSVFSPTNSSGWGGPAEQDFLVLLDNEPPALHNCPPAMQVLTEPGKDYAIASWASPFVTDNIGVASLTSSVTSGSQFPLRPLGGAAAVVELVAKDRYGNTARCNFTVVVEDAEDPFVQCITPLHLILDQGLGMVVIDKATWTDLTTFDNSPWPVTIQQPALRDLELGPGKHEVGLITRLLLLCASKCSVSLICQHY